MMRWQDRVVEQVAATSARTRKSGPKSHPWVGILLRVHPDIARGIKQVADDADVSVTTYVRRLLTMSIVKHRKEPLSIWLAKSPEAAKPNNQHIYPLTTNVNSDTGLGMEGMCTHPGCDLIHW